MRALRLAPAVVALCVAGLALAAPSTLDPGKGIILSSGQAQSAARQCSRISPGPVQDVWVPTPPQIWRLEQALPAYFRAAAVLEPVAQREHIDTEAADRLLPRYYRQYAGLIVGGRRIVYLNAVIGEESNTRYFDWRHKVIGVCDGGTITFGVEFDPATGKFDHFAFNGEL